MVSVHTEVPMPVQLFTEAERARRNRFPDVIAYEELVTFFTLSERDLRSIPRSRDPHNRLGYALQLCTLRLMGFVPDDLRSAPPRRRGLCRAPAGRRPRRPRRLRRAGA